MTGAHLIVDDLSWSPARHAAPLLHPTSFELPAGKVMGVVGPNGAGKTTMLRLLYRFHRPMSGTVHIDGDEIWTLTARDAAMRVAAVLQEHPSDFALTVRDIVALGRIPHRKSLGTASGAKDHAVIEASLDRLDLGALSHRHLGTLSGGERQRVMVARALAQEPQLLILDEPTNHLDIRHQLEVLALIRSLPLTIITSLHDLNLAASVCDHVLLLQDGHSVAFGNPDKVLTEAAIAQAFNVDARREMLAPSNTNHLTFHL